MAKFRRSRKPRTPITISPDPVPTKNRFSFLSLLERDTSDSDQSSAQECKQSKTKPHPRTKHAAPASPTADAPKGAFHKKYQRIRTHVSAIKRQHFKVTSIKDSDNCQLPFLEIICNESRLQTLLDTGAKASTILINNIPPKFRTIQPTNARLTAANNLPIHGAGTANLPFSINGTHFTHTFFVVKNIPHQVILGHDFFSRHNCILNFEDLTLSAKINNQLKCLGHITPPSIIANISFNVAPARPSVSTHENSTHQFAPRPTPTHTASSSPNTSINLKTSQIYCKVNTLIPPRSTVNVSIKFTDCSGQRFLLLNPLFSLAKQYHHSVMCDSP